MYIDESGDIMEIHAGKRAIMYKYAGLMSAISGAKKASEGVDAPYLKHEGKSIVIPMDVKKNEEISHFSMSRALASGFVYCQPTETGLNRIAYDIKKGEALMAKNGGELQSVTMDQVRNDITNIMKSPEVKNNNSMSLSAEILEDEISEFSEGEQVYNQLTKQQEGKAKALDTKEGRQTMLDLLAYHVKAQGLTKSYRDDISDFGANCSIQTPDHHNIQFVMDMPLGDIKRRLVAGDVYNYVEYGQMVVDHSDEISFDKKTGQVISQSHMESCDVCGSVKNKASHDVETRDPKYQEAYDQLKEKMSTYVSEHESVIDDIMVDGQIESLYTDLYDNPSDYGTYGDDSAKYPNGNFDYTKYECIQVEPEAASQPNNDGRMPAGLSDIESSDEDNYQLD